MTSLPHLQVTAALGEPGVDPAGSGGGESCSGDSLGGTLREPCAFSLWGRWCRDKELGIVSLGFKLGEPDFHFLFFFFSL